MMGLVLLQRQHLLIAGTCLLLCTASNLAAPVLSGMLLDTLVQRQPLEQYMQVSGAAPRLAALRAITGSMEREHGWQHSCACDSRVSWKHARWLAC